MGYLEVFISFLKDMGFTTQSTIPLVVIFLIGYILLNRKLDKSLTPIRFAIVEIQGVFGHAKVPLRYCLTETAGSPLRPTDFGMKIVQDSGLSKIIQDKKLELLGELDNKMREYKAFSAYDVQEKAIELISQRPDSPLMQGVKNYAFENGIELEPILRVGGLLLRDEYLKQHPEVSQKNKE